MAKYSRLLVAVDGSETSLHALRESFKLTGSWVTVVAVAPFYEGDLRLVGVPGAERVMREPCDTALSRAQELAQAAGAVIQPVCQRGEPHERLVELAETGSRDLIVMGAKGHGFMERVLVGSVTQRVIGFSPKDVLVVPPEGSIGWDRILLATDGSADSEAAGVRALDLARDYGSELSVVAALDLPAGLGEGPEVREALLEACQRDVAQVRDRAEAMGLRTRALVREGAAYQVITDLARDEQAQSHRFGQPRPHGAQTAPHGQYRRTGHRPRPLPGAGGEEKIVVSGQYSVASFRCVRGALGAP